MDNEIETRNKMVVAAARAHSGHRIVCTDYKRFLPVPIQQQVDYLIDFLATEPYLRPDSCPHCNSKKFKNRQVAKNGVGHYICHYCKKHFTRLTGTPLNHAHSHEHWVPHIKMMFAGNRQKHICETLNLSPPSVQNREIVLEAVMKEHFSELHSYWMHYKFALNEEVPQKIVAEIEQFRQWLQPIVTAQNVCCPFCGSYNIRHSHKINPNARKRRNGRICNQCYKDFSILHGTPLYKAKRLEQYLTYFELLLKGVGDVEIWKIVGISCRTTQRWWFLLTEQMQKMNLNVLIDWIIWRQIAHERHIHFLSRKAVKEEAQRLKNIERLNALQKNQDAL